ncbi:YeiH family protein [Curtobacterium ammoniigenes]|uniref:YeiH family protein n=1 Tax=Curtobacterium ammoniigenes TaxID=395387 RepID=UPI0008301C4B|nr:putative sulfate exporter family transporter [Curtobacterium ammoniigenes]
MSSPATAAHTRTRLGSTLPSKLPGLALALAIAIVATLVGRVVPVLGGPVPAVLIGAIVGTVMRRSAAQTFDRVGPGVKFASGFVLQLAVVILGAQLSLGQVLRIGGQTLPVMLTTLTVCLLGAWLLGRLLRVSGTLRTLIGVGTGICGASAIAAVTPVIDAAGADVAYAMSTIFLCNVAAVFVFPLLGHALGLSQHAFGIFAGTAVNDTSSVVATATVYGAQATNTAVVVKLVRTLMIIPIVLGLAGLEARHATRTTDQPRASRPRIRLTRLVPWFLVGFLVVVLARTVGVVPAAAAPSLAFIATFFITTALAAIGLSTDVAAIRRAGVRPLILGVSLWAIVAATSLGVQALLGTL